jgi:hypothetical protein
MYQQISMAIAMVRKIGAFFHRCFVCCCPGGCQDMEQVVAQWRQPVASNVALDMLHQAIHFVSHRRTAMATKMASGEGGLFLSLNFYLNITVCCS